MRYNYFENGLRGKARELITNGRLPCQQPMRIWGGHGTGEQVCSVCDRVISSDEVEYEVEHESGGTTHLSRFHVLCHAAWQVECAGEETVMESAP
jgi:hypothetical protein